MSQELNKTHCQKSKIDLAVFYVKWAMSEKTRASYRMLDTFSLGGIMQNASSTGAILHEGERVINKELFTKRINVKPTSKEEQEALDRLAAIKIRP